MSKAKKCKHEMRRIVSSAGSSEIHRTGEVLIFTNGAHAVADICAACGDQLPLGPSNDDSPAVRLEMLAAIHLGGDRPLPDAWDARDGIVEFGNSERIPEAWPWDPTRPLAGQYEAWERAAEIERYLDGWTGPDDDVEQEHQDMLTMHDASDDYDPPAASDCPEHPGADANDYGDCMECSAMADDPAGMVDLKEDVTATAADYESQRAAEPDCRDEDGPEVDRLMAEATAADVCIGLPGDDLGTPIVVHVAPTATNCKLLGAERCEHDREDGEL